MDDSWDPDLYRRFQQDRARPFHDLLGLVQPVAIGAVAGAGAGDSDSGDGHDTRLLDLGCGPGELTALAHRTLHTTTTLGMDTSPAMLARAHELDEPGLDFVEGDLRSLDALPAPAKGAERGWDVILANASLHWVGDHPGVLSGWRAQLRRGGQLAVQVPANPDHPSHTTITEVLTEEPFSSALDHRPPPDPLRSVLAPEQYAEVLWSLGASEQVVRLQVYGMEMPSWADVVEWTSGTALVRVRDALPAELYGPFVERYRTRLGEHLEHRAPYFYAFKRILMWARFP